jgi:hypothetical protein
MEWSFIVPENDWIIAEEEHMPVLASGEALLRGLRLLPYGGVIPKEGKEVSQDIMLHCNLGQLEAPAEFEQPSLQLLLRVMPSYWPGGIQVRNEITR